MAVLLLFVACEDLDSVSGVYRHLCFCFSRQTAFGTERPHGFMILFVWHVVASIFVSERPDPECLEHIRSRSPFAGPPDSEWLENIYPSQIVPTPNVSNTVASPRPVRPPMSWRQSPFWPLMMCIRSHAPPCPECLEYLRLAQSRSGPDVLKNIRPDRACRMRSPRA